MLTSHELLELIQFGENSKVEFKEVRIGGGKVLAPHRDSLSDEIAAFANQRGGTIIFGVADGTNQIIGIDQSDIPVLVKFIGEICIDSINPPIVDIYVNSARVTDEFGIAKILTYVVIGRSLWIHENPGGYLYRISDSKRKMSPEHLLRVAQKRAGARVIHFDELAVPNAKPSVFEDEFLFRYTADISPESLHKRHLLTRMDGEWKPTVAGVLMCSSRPDRFIYNSFIQAVRYSGLRKDSNYQIDAKDCIGPLDRQVVDAYKFVEQHNQIAAKKEIGRHELPQYSMRAIFEALVNAVVHRDYSIHTSKTRLFLFADRIELYSPGVLANNLTVDNLISSQATRNELLSRLLSDLTLDDDTSESVSRRHFLERRGEGVGIILSESEALSNRSPVYELLDNELRLTIYAASFK